jgi:hypothetical protein
MVQAPQRALGRVEIKPDDLGGFGGKLGIVADAPRFPAGSVFGERRQAIPLSPLRLRQYDQVRFRDATHTPLESRLTLL